MQKDLKEITKIVVMLEHAGQKRGISPQQKALAAKRLSFHDRRGDRLAEQMDAANEFQQMPCPDIDLFPEPPSYDIDEAIASYMESLEHRDLLFTLRYL